MINGKQVTLDEVCIFINGGAWTSKEYADDGIPVVQVTNIQNGTIVWDIPKYIPFSSLPKYQKNILHTHDLVIATVGSHPTVPTSMVGRAVIIPDSANNALLNQNAVCIRPKDSRLDKLYLGYLGQSHLLKGYIAGVAKGAANQVRLAIGNLKRFSFVLPEIEVQKKIAGILSAYDDLIANNERRMALLEEAIHLLYREWFVHLRFPGHEDVAVNAGIPDGWEFVKLEQVAFLNYGKSLTKNNRIEGAYPVYGSSGIVGTHNEYLADAPAIIVGRKGNVGSVYWSSIPCYPIDTVFYISSEQANLYIYHNLQYQNFINSDAAVPGLNRNFAHSRIVLLPETSILSIFENQATAAYRQIENLRQQNQILKEARDALLPRLMSGKLTV